VSQARGSRKLPERSGPPCSGPRPGLPEPTQDFAGTGAADSLGAPRGVGMGAARHLLGVAMLCALFASAASFTDPPDGEYPGPSSRRLRPSSTYPVACSTRRACGVSESVFVNSVPNARVNVVACTLSGTRLQLEVVHSGRTCACLYACLLLNFAL